jgi:hypothetical protein
MALLPAIFFQPSVFRLYFNLFGGGIPQIAAPNASFGSILYFLAGADNIAYAALPALAALASIPLIYKYTEGMSLTTSSACVLPWSLLTSPYCWGHDYFACFFTPFVALVYLALAVEERRMRLLLSLSAGIVVLAMVANLISPSFRFPWLFVFYGIALASVSWLTVHAHAQMGSLHFDAFARHAALSANTTVG